MNKTIVEYKVYYLNGKMETFYTHLGIDYAFCVATIHAYDSAWNPDIERIETEYEQAGSVYNTVYKITNPEYTVIG